MSFTTSSAIMRPRVDVVERSEAVRPIPARVHCVVPAPQHVWIPRLDDATHGEQLRGHTRHHVFGHLLQSRRCHSRNARLVVPEACVSRRRLDQISSSISNNPCGVQITGGSNPKSRQMHSIRGRIAGFANRSSAAAGSPSEHSSTTNRETNRSKLCRWPSHQSRVVC